MRNCPDGSDETAANCVHLRGECRPPYFLCTYGACIVGNSACNGVANCLDKSDETLLRCGDEDARNKFSKLLQGNCNADEMKCPSGICIENHKTCDGVADCEDGSDETVEICGHIPCPEYLFTCGYGACISAKLTCDGKKDCFDNSDEAPILCNLTRNINTDLEISSKPTTTLSVGCPLPFGNERPITKNRHKIIVNDPILYGEVHFSCPKGHTLVGDSVGYCSKKVWNINPPKCLKYCDSSKIMGFSTKPTCNLDGQTKDCYRKKLEPGTVVSFLCADYFQNETSLPVLRCLDDGTWSDQRDRRKCVPQCGQEGQETQEFSAHGIQVNNTRSPWHVGIYDKLNEIEYRFTCGGTILTPDLIITAAHCIWDKALSRAYNPELFRVVASKLYRDYEKTERNSQKRDILRIIPDEKFNGKSNNYLSDIALLVLKDPFSFSDTIRPICTRYYSNAEKGYRTNEVDGRFGSWDIYDEHKFQLVTGTSKSYDRCIKEHNILELATDKFCFLSGNDGIACRGDSGSGFVSKVYTDRFEKTSDPKRFHLYGIISNAPGSANCAEGPVVLTNIQYFQSFIESHERESYSQRG